MKGLEVIPNLTEVTVTLREETSSISPFGQPDWHASFTRDRVAIETTEGNVVRERSNPRASFAGHVLDTPWDALHRAYFMGYAQWTYLTTPFFMTMPGFEVTEISPWQEGGEVWHGLRVKFPTCGAILWRNISTILWRQMDSAFRLSAVPTCAGHI